MAYLEDFKGSELTLDGLLAYMQNVITNIDQSVNTTEVLLARQIDIQQQIGTIELATPPKTANGIAGGDPVSGTYLDSQPKLSKLKQFEEKVRYLEAVNGSLLRANSVLESLNANLANQNGAVQEKVGQHYH
jgi:hypothetical protein